MIKLENYEVVGWEHAIRGMRNPMNSWEKSDSFFGESKEDVYEAGCYIKSCDDCAHKDQDTCLPEYTNWGVPAIGPNNRDLMMRLANGGPVHAKYRRMITVYVDITAPLYWWKEFDTYKVGTVANSCSTMHKIHEKEFTLEDFSCEYLDMLETKRLHDDVVTNFNYVEPLNMILTALNCARKMYLETKDKLYWWQMIQLLPSSYNQKRTVMLNYEVLAGIYKWRKNHKLDEWVDFCKFIESLPYSEIITGKGENDG